MLLRASWARCRTMAMALAALVATATVAAAQGTGGTITGIGEVLNIDFPRPRSREDIMEDPRYYELRNSALDFLYNRFAHDDDA